MRILNKLVNYHLSRYFKLGLFLFDILLLNIAFLLSFFIRYKNFEELKHKETQTLWFFSILFWIFLSTFKSFYRSIRAEAIELVLERTFWLVLSHLTVVSLFIVVARYTNTSRLRIFFFYIIFFFLLFFCRLFLIRFLKNMRSKGFNFKNVIIVGANEMGQQIYKILSKDLTYGYKVLGFFDDEKNLKTIKNSLYLGALKSIENYIAKNKVNEMYIALHIDKIKIINELTQLCERNMIRIKFIPDFQLYTKAKKVEILFYENLPVLTLRKEPLQLTLNRTIKKLFDIIFSSIVILLIFPWLFPILIILIKITSSGPIFFSQERSGRGKKSFKCLKFRTMHINKDSDKIQATSNDVRITKIGAFMRKTSLDELPQFFNVLSGKMSVVGPRPHMLKHTEQYSALINNYLVRHYAKPGITGWAQVNGYRGEIKELSDIENRVAYDIWYIENWSLLLDIKIIWRTLKNTLIGDKNAY